MAPAGRIFRVFVSSTFGDMCAERDALREHVFDKLRILCAERRASFQAVDLRWGISDGAALSQQVLDICLQEVHRCRETTRRPNFIALLGERYGSRLAPSRIPSRHFRDLVRAAADDPDASLFNWYVQDCNARPAAHLLKDRTGRYAETNVWRGVEARILGLLGRASRQLGESEPLYGVSATELEIEEGIFAGDAGGAYCYIRSIPDLPQDEAGHAYVDLVGNGKPDSEAKRRLANLKRRLLEGLPAERVHEYEATWDPLLGRVSDESLEQLCARVLGDLSGAIRAELQAGEGSSDLEQELDAHNDFCASRARFFTGRGELINQLISQAVGGGRAPLVLCGESGSGKSAVMARVSEILRERYPETIVVHRFVGATPASTDLRSLLQGICREITERCGIKGEVPQDYAELVERLPGLLMLAGKRRPFILLLDALDQLSPRNDAHDLGWLPTEIPRHASLVVSALEAPGAPGRCLVSARRILSKKRFRPLSRLEPEEGQVILDRWLRDAKRRLTSEQRADLLQKFEDCGLPLFLKVAFEEARRWRSFDGLPCGADDVPGLNETVKGVLHDMFARLEEPDQHGPVLVARSMGYLGAARNGLSDDELLNVLSADKRHVMRDFRNRSPDSPPVKSLPPIVWSRLYFDLEPYLMQRAADQTSLLVFYHRQVGEVVTERYLKGSSATERSRLLARKFAREKNWLVRRARERLPNLRKASELIFQMIRAKSWDGVEAALCDVDFLLAKCEAHMVFDLVSEYEEALSTADVGLDRVTAFAEFVRARAHLLTREPRLLLEMAYDSADSGVLPESAAAELKRPRYRKHQWIRRFNRRRRGTGACLQTMAEHTDRVNCVAIAPDRSLVFSGSDDKTSKVWEAATGRCRNTLEGHRGGVKDMALTADGKLLFTGSTDGRVGVWDLSARRAPRFLTGHKRTVCAVVISPDQKLVVTGSQPTTKTGAPARIIAWEIASLKTAKSIELGIRDLEAIAISPDGKILLAGGHSGIQAWDLGSESALWSKVGWNHTSECMVVRPRGGLFVNGSGALHFRRVSDGEERKSIGYDGMAQSVALTNGGSLAVTADYDGKVKIWDLKTRKLRTAHSGHSRAARAVAVSPDGLRAVSGSDDHTVKLWDLSVTGEDSPKAQTNRELTGMAAIAGSDRIITGRTYADPEIWRLSTHTCERLGFATRPSMRSFVVTADGRELVTASEKGIRFWDLSSRERTREVPLDAGSIRSFALCPSGERAFLAVSESVNCWDLATGERVWSRKGHGYIVNAVRCTPDGKLLITAGWELGIKVRDPATGRVLRTLKEAEANVYSVAVHPDGRRIVAGGRAGTVEAFDAVDGSCLWSRRPHISHVWTVSVTPDGVHAVSAGTDAVVIVWDVASGVEIARFLAQGEIRHCLAAREREIVIADVHGNVDFLELLLSGDTAGL